LNDAESQASRILNFCARAPDPDSPGPELRLALLVGDSDRAVGESEHAAASTAAAIAGSESLKLDIILLRVGEHLCKPPERTEFERWSTNASLSILVPEHKKVGTAGEPDHSK